MDSPYSKKSDQFLELLDKEESHLREVLQANQADLAELQSDWQERDSPAERNIRAVEWNQFASIQEALKEIEIAKRRLSEGTFGICSVCEEVIPEGRLLAVPVATKCLECQAEDEREKELSPKPSL